MSDRGEVEGLNPLGQVEGDRSRVGAGLGRRVIGDAAPPSVEDQGSPDELLDRHPQIEANRLSLERERQHFVELFELAPDAYLVTDVDGTVREANQAAGDLLGVGPPHLRGRALVRFVDDASTGELRAFMLRHVDSCCDDMRAAARELSFVLRVGDDSTRHVSATVAAVRDRDGRCVGLRWLLRDVSDRVRVDREVRRLNEELERRVADRTAQLELRTHELEIASGAKSDFLAVMSHELRTPLQAILGFADLMRTDIPESMPAYARKWADHIHRAAEHLLALVEQILRFSRLEAGCERMQPERVELAALVRELALLVEPAAQLKGLTVTVKVPSDGVTMTTDPGKLRQILFNLLANALKFTDRGEITLEVRTEQNGVSFEIRDTGVGIAAEHLERVFEQFWQAECRPTAGKGGTGLGLSIARQLARLLGGDVTVQSQLGAGSVFRAHFPFDLPLDEAGPAERTEAEALALPNE